MSDPNIPQRTPVYFLGIGGPNFMENTDHPAYSKLAATGRDLTTKVKPKAVVVFSAHWQEGSNTIKINSSENADLIYDFYSFPAHYYEYKYPNRGSLIVAEIVIKILKAADIKVEKVKRGLDHSVWAGFIVVLLYGNKDTDKHYRIGQVLESLRDEGMLIISVGIAVYNLYNFRLTIGIGKTLSYVIDFDQPLKTTATANPKERQEKKTALTKRSDAKKAHPTLEHLLPMYISAVAAGSDISEQLWTLPEGSMS